MPTLKASRRIFLRNAVLTALAPSARGQQSPAANAHVDAHVHVWTPDTKSYPLADGFTKEKNMVPPSFTPEELFAQCRPSGVGKIVLIQMNFYRFDNSYMLDSMAAHPGVFSGVAVVDESQADLGDT
ncbi:MAG: amidohydrolase family protein, partial [Verrucomicrobiaceae bacterium]